MGLYVTARPGPYQYSELIYDGLPGWLCENYPQLLARNFQGEVFRKSSVSYLHPLFLEKVQRWYDVICPILARYTVSRGGPITFVQFDNELTGIHEWFGSLDYNREHESGQPSGRFTASLRELYRYQPVGMLPTALPFPPSQPWNRLDYGGTQARDIRCKKDYFDFYLPACGICQPPGSSGSASMCPWCITPPTQK
jgi:hypothetical protein